MKTIPIDWEKAERTILECLDVPKEWLPESYRGKRSHRNLWSVQKEYDRRMKQREIDPNDISVKFDNGKIREGTPERLERLKKYADDVANDRDICYNVNEDKLYRLEQAFALAMELDLEEEE